MLNLNLLHSNLRTNLPRARTMAVTGRPNNLSQSPAGQTVTVRDLGDLPPASRQHLQAYGLVPGRTVLVLSQSPVTIILVEQTELAFEKEIALKVLID